jgi:O-antigen/teichoic acid export membrane protein
MSDLDTSAPFTSPDEVLAAGSALATADAPARPAPRHLERSSASLLANTAFTGALGALFWLVAARLFPADQIGAAVAASSLLIALAFAAQLNLATALSRFLPGAGAQQRSMVFYAYRMGSLSAVAVGGVMALIAIARGGVLVDGWSPALIAALVLSLPVWVVFTLQDSVLVAVRRSEWVPIENTVASIAKLLVLPLCVGIGGGAGVLVAWTAPAIPLVLGVTVILVRRFLDPGRERFTAKRSLMAYAVKDLPGSVMYLLSLRLVPLLVVQRIGPTAGAYIGVPWTILSVAAMVLPSLSRSLLAELSHDDVDQAVLLRRAVRLVFVVLAPCAVVGFVAAGPLLAIAGAPYEAFGQLVLAWGLLGMVPAALVECELAVLRFRNRVTFCTTAQILRAIALIASVVVLVEAGHSEYIGVAFFLVGVVTAAAVGLVMARPSLRSVARLVPLAVGVPLGFVAISQTDTGRIGDMGLIQAVPPLYYVALALVIVGLFICMGAKRRAPLLTVLHVGAMIVLLHGLPALVEANPRFPIAWLHAGFVDQLASNGKLLPALDARFSWAGFFAGNALIEQAGASGAPVWLLKFTPLFVNAAACWAIWVIGKPFRFTQRQRLCALPVFVLANWVGQDYFSPQATNFVLFLIVVAVVVNVFGLAPVADSKIGRFVRSGPVDSLDLDPQQSVLVYLAVVAMIAAVIVSHQLTPFFLAGALLLMGLTKSIKVRTLGFVTLAGVITWIAYSAEAYWVGHWDKLVGSTGAVNTLVQRNLSDRAATSDLARALVVNSRIALAGVVWLLAGVALVRAWRRHNVPVALACLLVAPFPVMLLQSYGGEMLLRVYLFAVPPSALLIGTLMAPAGRDLRLGRRLVMALVLSLSVPAFMLARYGNERFEQVTSDDLGAVETVYNQAPDGATVYVINPQTVVYSERVDQIRFAVLKSTEDASTTLRELSARGKDHPSYLLVTASQLAYEEQVHGRPDDWAGTFETELASSGKVEVVSRSGDTLLLRLKETT